MLSNIFIASYFPLCIVVVVVMCMHAIMCVHWLTHGTVYGLNGFWVHRSSTQYTGMVADIL